MPEPGRRGFLYGLLASVGAVITAWYVFLFERFMLPPPPAAATWQRVGKSSDFPALQPKLVTYTGDGGFPDGVYVVRLAHGLRAYDVHCVHLQCTVEYIAGTRTFDCPCHGSVYTLENKVVGGPAPHGLNLHKIRERNGIVEIGGLLPGEEALT